MPRIVDHEATRADLLERAFDLFANSGYGAVTMRELARFLGVSTGTLYHYFATKEHFFGEMVRHVSRRDMLKAVSLIGPGDSLVARAEALRHFVRENEEHLRNLLLLSLDFFRQGRDSDRIGVRDVLRGFVQAVRDNMGGGPDDDAETVLASVIGALVIRILDPESTVLERLALTPPLVDSGAA
jgi:AcrR family transcriptional regulator